MAVRLNIICLAACDWEATWQPTQEIMMRLARLGHRVLYVEPTGTRNVRLSDWRRAWKRLQPLPLAPHPNLTLARPWLVPLPLSLWWAKVNRMIVHRAVDRWLGPVGKCDVLWAWFPSPLNVELRAALWPVSSIYQMMSTITAVRKQPAILEAEHLMLDKYNHIFVNSDGLRKQAQTYNTQTFLFRAACDSTLFDHAKSYIRPKELPTGKPIIGYLGAVHQWFDMSLLVELCRRLRDYQFVVVGPAETVPYEKNLYWAGSRPHDRLPAYLAAFDVCLIPYKADAYTETSFPAKLNEYLAMGKPVVATRTPELEAYEHDTGLDLGLCRTIEEWTQTITKKVMQREPTQYHQRISAAIQHNAAYQVNAMLDIIHDHRALYGYQR